MCARKDFLNRNSIFSLPCNIYKRMRAPQYVVSTTPVTPRNKVAFTKKTRRMKKAPADLSCWDF
nr:MAG TPA: hypothetical protein [Caudoviricetes sp.]